MSQLNLFNNNIPTIDDMYKQVDSFISLDISKSSTGWVRYRDGVREEGYFPIRDTKGDLVRQRRLFRQFAIDLFQDQEYQYVFIEDTIQSINYKTGRILNQLNCIVDDLMDMGIIPQSPIIREGNGTWKKNLKAVSGYKPPKGENHKVMVRNCLANMGYGVNERRFIKEDIFDAHGIAVGVIYRLSREGVL